MSCLRRGGQYLLRLSPDKRFSIVTIYNGISRLRTIWRSFEHFNFDNFHPPPPSPLLLQIFNLDWPSSRFRAKIPALEKNLGNILNITRNYWICKLWVCWKFNIIFLYSSQVSHLLRVNQGWILNHSEKNLSHNKIVNKTNWKLYTAWRMWALTDSEVFQRFLNDFYW